MLFEELVLHNFGIYKGRHCINLAPKKANKPVILFGALNGGGKTTFLDALQLALYGKFANCSNRGSLSYPDYLKLAINHHANPSEGACVELQFRHRREGVEDTIRVNRMWRSTGKGLKEVVEVIRNGKFDPVVTDRWYEFVEEFIPAQISSLFFFDGEKIETLAAPEKSSELIRTGLHALLGLDLVDRLSKDLLTVERKRKTELKTADEQAKLAELQAHTEALKERRKELSENTAQKRTELDITEGRISRLREKFRREGGELLEQRDALEAEKNATLQRLKDAEDKLRDLAAGGAPFLLVQDLLKNAQNQCALEAQVKTHIKLKETLEKRDLAVVRALKRKKVDTAFLQILGTHLKRDLEKRDQDMNVDMYLDIEPDAFSELSENTLNDLRDVIVKQVALTEHIAEHLSDIDRKLAAIPDPETLFGINENIKHETKERQHILLNIEVLERESDQVNKQIEAREEEYKRHLERTTNQKFADETTQRILHHSSKLRNIFSEFRRRVAERHIAQLEILILESFQQLIRKSDLVSRVSITPDSYELTLYNKTGENLPSDRLSAGERQLLAVSLLWGLAKASGRPLPCVIDTPLGRLDGTHRSHLVKNYFPYASHQVLLLSTDEEIDDRYHKDLKISIGLEYQIEYDEGTSSSRVNPGYFW